MQSDEWFFMIIVQKGNKDNSFLVQSPHRPVWEVFVEFRAIVKKISWGILPNSGAQNEASLT